MENSAIIIITILVLAVLVFAGYNLETEKIRESVVGTELSFISHDLTKVTYVVKQEDIIGIELTECGWINHTVVDKQCYKVSIGENRERASWYIFYDKNSLEQVKVEQLFVT